MIGFTFKGIHSSAYNLYYKTDSRELMPTARRSTVTIPQRSGAHVQQYGDYEEREESFTCSFIKNSAMTIPATARKIAAWLSGTGKLVFDDEPDVYYMATILDAPAFNRQRQIGEFQITFVSNPPFALSEPKTEALGATKSVSYAGTIKSPTVIILKNDGETAIQNIEIVIRRRGM